MNASAVHGWSAPAIAVDGWDELFPVRNVYCVTRNYDPRATEAPPPDRERPAIFTKATSSVSAHGATLPYPPATTQLEPEVELVAALGVDGAGLDAAAAQEIIFGYAVGFDMTRRDLQRAARAEGKPWEVAKWFEGATPLSTIRPAAGIGHPQSGTITLDVNGARVQEGDLSQLIWKPAEVVALLSEVFTLRAGDIVFTGTPAGEAIVAAGDTLTGAIEGVGTLTVSIA